MSLAIPFEQIRPDDARIVGGKALALTRLVAEGIPMPAGLCVSTLAYRRYLTETRLGVRLRRELRRKPFEDMRWEELWDTALRIRTMFLNTPLSSDLQAELVPMIDRQFAERPVVVRSSAPGEDTARTSFAGLHDSFVNVRGTASILDHIRLVWASLWSDRALLYRQELGLDVASSDMAVVVQDLVDGERSGVVFSESPTNRVEAVVESVYGLNQGLVDGTVQPDRWILERRSGKLLEHIAAERTSALRVSPQGAQMLPLAPDQAARPPLEEGEVGRVFMLAQSLEQRFGQPQDVEWTWRGETLYALQSRPVTTRADSEDKRQWYLTLTRSFENLQALRRRVEGELIPEMARAAAELGRQNPTLLSDHDLAAEIVRRGGIRKHWTDVYWADFIPLAHGVRLFGQVYNDTVRPSDPYEFTRLLGATRMQSLARNAELERLAAMIREYPERAARLRRADGLAADTQFAAGLDAFLSEFGELVWKDVGLFRERESLLRLLLEMAGTSPTCASVHSGDIDQLKTRFLDQFPTERRVFAAELLDLARASYQLRDDDNIHLARIEAQFLAAETEGRRRLDGESNGSRALADAVQRFAVRPDLDHGKDRPSDVVDPEGQWTVYSRQLLGQPAGPGVATGLARIVESAADLFEFRRGEILVCDAVDPNMTLVVPLAAAIVERRGGMLIHGAIIAREYGLPCVTGVAEATTRIRTGDRLDVDGQLGLVVCTRRS
jgi:pyruvate,water dikinase